VLKSRINRQDLTVEVTVAPQLNQGKRKKSVVYLFFLDFFVLFYQEKSTGKIFFAAAVSCPSAENKKSVRRCSCCHLQYSFDYCVSTNEGIKKAIINHNSFKNIYYVKNLMHYHL